MKWPFFLKKKTTERDDGLIDRYKEIRKVSLNLNMALAKQLPKAAVPECGKKLGIFKAGTLILNNDDEIAILYDYCLYHYRRADKNPIERHLEQTPPAPESTEALLLRAMADSRFSLFRVEEIKPHQGAAVRDLLAGDTLDLMDISLSETAEPGLILAGRILPLPDFNMSSGTLIPIPEPVYEEKIVPVINKYRPDPASGSRPNFSQAQEASFVAQIVRIALREGGEDNVFYTDVEH